MKKLALGALFAGLAACGGGSSKTTVSLVDSGPGGDGSGSSGACNPLAQTGCNAGEKCNWIYDQLMPTVVGHIGCEAAGTVAIGGSCGARAVGPDTCVKGAECVSGECKQICDNQGGDPKCDADHACVRYQNLFTDGTNTVAGVCDPGCDPLTQDLKVGTNKTACGSPDPTMPVKGCYGYGEYSCSGTAPTVPIATAVTLTDRVMPAGDYLNACAPGFMPVLIAETGSMSGLCNGLCAALEVDNTAAHTGNELGDAAALAKTPTGAAAAAGNGTCGANKRGSVGEGPETCRFAWIYFDYDDTAGTVNITDYTDKIGVCFARSKYKYDSNDNGMLDANDVSTPACNTLPPRRQPSPPGCTVGTNCTDNGTSGTHDDAADFFCQKVANSMFADKPLKKGDKVYVGDLGIEASVQVYKPTEGGVPMTRHVFTNN